MLSFRNYIPMPNLSTRAPKKHKPFSSMIDACKDVYNIRIQMTVKRSKI